MSELCLLVECASSRLVGAPDLAHGDLRPHVVRDWRLAADLARRWALAAIVVCVDKLDAAGLGIVGQLVRLEAAPTLVLAASIARADHAAVARLGAGELLRGPASWSELCKSIESTRARTRRAAAPQAERPAARWCIDWSLGALTVDRTEIALTPLELVIVSVLAKSPGRFIGRELLVRACGMDDDGATAQRRIDSHVSRIRRKLRSEGVAAPTIEVRYRLGYRIRD
jgi:two-component system, OmpR family, response regulator BaeR